MRKRGWCRHARRRERGGWRRQITGDIRSACRCDHLDRRCAQMPCSGRKVRAQGGPGGAHRLCHSHKPPGNFDRARRMVLRVLGVAVCGQRLVRSLYPIAHTVPMRDLAVIRPVNRPAHPGDAADAVFDALHLSVRLLRDRKDIGGHSMPPTHLTADQVSGHTWRGCWRLGRGATGRTAADSVLSGGFCLPECALRLVWDRKRVLGQAAPAAHPKTGQMSSGAMAGCAAMRRNTWSHHVGSDKCIGGTAAERLCAAFGQFAKAMIACAEDRQVWAPILSVKAKPCHD